MAKELKIGSTYYAFNFNRINPTKVEYVGLVYYVGKGMYSRNLGFNKTPNDVTEYMFPHKADMFVPYSTEGIECSRFNTNELIRLDISPIDYRIDNCGYVDIPSENLNEYDWWRMFVEKYDLE